MNNTTNIELPSYNETTGGNTKIVNSLILFVGILVLFVITFLCLYQNGKKCYNFITNTPKDESLPPIQPSGQYQEYHRNHQVIIGNGLRKSVTEEAIEKNKGIKIKDKPIDTNNEYEYSI